MLKSTYKPSAAVQAGQPLPPGWTEHKAPTTGQTYYHNAATGKSTYMRPGVLGPALPVPQLQLSDPRVANAFMASMAPPPPPQNQHNTRGGGFAGRGGRGRGGGEGGRGPRPQPIDKPRSKVAIPGCEPWILVYTKYGRRFAYNPSKNASYWRIPERLKAGILELDQARIKEKVDKAMGTATSTADKKAAEKAKAPAAAAAGSAEVVIQQPHEDDDDDNDNQEGEGDSEKEVENDDDDSSEYEELEVTDDEDGPEEYQDPNDEDNPRPKRQRTEEPTEFNEDDIAFQLQAMGEEYGLESGDYDDGNMEEWPEGAEGTSLSDEDARALFKDLLNDFRVNPYSPFDKLIEEGKVFDDPRYTVLTTMKDRRDVWEEWSREGIKLLRERRAKEEKKDPRIAFFAFLSERATPKLYWPEFKRKHRKEPPMKDAALSDKDREKWYRELVSRLKLPQATLKADLTALLKSTSPKLLHGQTNPSHLPVQIITDMRYICVDAKTRDALVEAYISSLPPPPSAEAGEVVEQDGDDKEKARKKTREARMEQVLREREKTAGEEKRRQEKRLMHAKMVLREEERELEMAMGVSKRGLQSQLMDLENAGDWDTTGGEGICTGS